MIPFRSLAVGCFALTLTALAGISGRADVVYNPANGHYYEGVAVASGLGWHDAKTAAEARTYQGLKGHLVTITSYL